ncbi:uncharacterized protein BP5553_04908 [Venustampulla echinocandica]|uniref:Uncharacterized protein n=1 Tax=Venustampulla echinocandica TaxID=2656787 RepID=A0A370TPM7_9HELO|nr:uncharacterized protein BP5553_04908 [Venustampulla echinocandica]RDL37475.1 hypothetical protein BP5553_04908 [Venustampulla echinocandica]
MSSDDALHFDYFRVSCTEEFSRSFNPPLWKQLILRAAYTEPFMLHAVLSIGALRRSQLLPISSASTVVMLHYSKKWYEIATGELAEMLKAQSVDWKLALLGSLVFLAVEVLRGHEHGALLHFRSGFSILKSFALEGAIISPGTLHFSDVDEFDDAVNAFTRLSVEQYPFVGLHSSSNATPTLPSHFDTLVETRRSLNSIISSLDTFLRQYSCPSKPTPPSHPHSALITARQHAIQIILQEWHKRFHAFLSSSTTTQNVKDHAQVLLIQYLVASIRISTHFSVSQLIYDVYLPEFEQITVMAKAVIDVDNKSWPNSNGPCYTLNIAMAQPLYFVARYCRYSVVRKRAIGALRKVGREGIYTGRAVARVAEWIVGTEEGDMGHGFVAEEMRLNNVVFNIREDGRTAEVCAEKRGLLGTWEEIQDEIDLC